MSIVGKYRPCSFAIFTENGLKMGTKEEYIENARKHFPADPDEAKHEEGQIMMLVNAILEVCEDGKIYPYFQIPATASKEDIEKAVAAGEIKLASIEGYMCVDKPYDWKEEDGVYKYDTRETREVMGEKLSSWDDLKFDGKTITMSSGLSVYEKIEE